MSSSSQPIPPGHECLIPHLVCSPASEAIEFYKKAFGAEEVVRLPSPDGKRLMHASLRVNNGFVYLADDFPEYCEGKSETAIALKGTPVTLHQYTKDCDAAIQRAKAAGATVIMPATDMFWGDRYGVIVDPYGHKWSFATHQKDLSPKQIEQAMNDAYGQAPQ
ncbi:VOC family protein [Schlesneria paludicola]|uniref:VOC family protein n=1 Tax=Schlesneria paludicola TaxID=360056 RepID=UPI00029A21FA|nr:VOC family protein [Schlesneria paludicola]